MKINVCKNEIKIKYCLTNIQTWKTQRPTFTTPSA